MRRGDAKNYCGVEFLEGRLMLHGGAGSPHHPGDAPAPAAPTPSPEALVAPAGVAEQFLPDLTPLASQAKRFMHDWTVDRAQSPGRVLLRFTTAMANVGRGPMELRGGPTHGATQDVLQRVYSADGSTADRLAGSFTYHADHGHVHVDDFAQYTLRAVGAGGEPGAVVAASDKVSFCLVDTDHHAPALPRSPATPRYATCENGVQGISVGWADVYQRSLPNQWVDVTSVAAGEYWLEATADPQDRLVESDETNNTTRVRVTLAPADVVPRPDRFEPDDTPAAAEDFGTLGRRTESGLSIDTAADVDYFRLTAASSGTLAVELTTSAGSGGVSLALFDAAQTQLASSNTSGAAERVSATVSAGSVYYVRVNSSGSATSPAYTLTVNGPRPTVTVAAADPLAAEGAADAGAFTVTRNGPVDAPLTVRFALLGTAVNGADYAAISGSVVIPVLQASATVTLQPAQDSDAEGDEQAVLTVTPGEEYAVGGTGEAAVTILDANASPLPAPWAGADVGAVGIPGAAFASAGGGILVRGSGAPAVAARPAGLADAFHLAHRALAGDGAVTVRLDAWDGSAAATRAGVVLRRGTGPAAAGVALLAAGDGSLVYELRKADGKRAKATVVGEAAPGTWLRVSRAGRRVTAATSTDGSTWRTVGAWKFGGATPDVAGLVSTSSVETRTSTAAFWGATVVSVPAAPLGLAAAVRGGRIELAWTDRATDETAYVVERATRGRGKFAAVATLAPDSGAFGEVVTKRRMFYRVRAVNAAGTSGPSNVARA